MAWFELPQISRMHAFLTRQHGENEVWEIVKNRPRDH